MVIRNADVPQVGISVGDIIVDDAGTEGKTSPPDWRFSPMGKHQSPIRFVATSMP
jgi:hypothetical protein